MKELAIKIQVPCPDIGEMYNQGMGGIHLFDQRTAAYHLHCKSCVNVFIVYNMMHQKDLTLFDRLSLFDFSIELPEQKTESKRKRQYQFEPNNLPSNLPELLHSLKTLRILPQKKN